MIKDMPSIRHLYSVKLSDIDDQDETFRISSDQDISLLARSIDEIGLLNPPLLKEMDKGFIVVSGFRRIKALRLLKILETPGTLISPDRHCSITAIAANAFQRTLTLVEQVRGIRNLKKYMDIGAISEHSPGIFNCRMNTGLVQKLSDIDDMGDQVLELMASDRLAMPPALKLKQYDEITREEILSLFRRIRTSLSIQKEIITNLYEISMREDITPDGILESPEIKKILDDEEADDKKKGNLVRALLKKRRFPEISRAENEFRENMKRLRLGPGLKLEPPIHFEAKDYTFSFKFKNHDELLDNVDKLASAAGDPLLRQMIP